MSLVMLAHLPVWPGIPRLLYRVLRLGPPTQYGDEHWSPPSVLGVLGVLVTKPIRQLRLLDFPQLPNIDENVQWYEEEHERNSQGATFTNFTKIDFSISKYGVIKRQTSPCCVKTDAVPIGEVGEKAFFLAPMTMCVQLVRNAIARKGGFSTAIQGGIHRFEKTYQTRFSLMLLTSHACLTCLNVSPALGKF